MDVNLAGQPLSPEARRLEAFHAKFVQHHSYPARRNFLYEFGKDRLIEFGKEGWLPAPTVKESEPSPSKANRYPGQRFETTNQLKFLPYDDALRMIIFQPETKHRYVKAET